MSKTPEMSEIEEIVSEHWNGSSHTKETVRLRYKEDTGQYVIETEYLLSNGKISKFESKFSYDVEELKSIKKCIEKLLQEKIEKFKVGANINAEKSKRKCKLIENAINDSNRDSELNVKLCRGYDCETCPYYLKEDGS